MDNTLITGILIIVMIYYLTRAFSKNKKIINPYQDIINNKEYKIKGQWDK